MSTKINSKNKVLIIILFMMILPTISFFGFEMPVVYLLTPFGVFIFIFVLFGWIKIPPIIKPIIGVWLLVMVQIIISAMRATVSKLGLIIFPVDIVQHVVRFIFLISFAVAAYSGRISKEKFIKYFLIILTVGMSIGILQWIPWPGRSFFIKLYPFRDGYEQLMQLNRTLNLLRLHGFTQHATANGGIACFSFIYAVSVRRYYCKHNGLTLILIILSIVNIFASQARAGMLALAFSLILFYRVSLKYKQESIKTTLYFIGTVGSIITIASYLYNAGNIFVVGIYDRWIRLFETGGGSRMSSQPEYFLSIMQGADYILGLSRPVISRSALTYGVEVEPINIFVTYGISGFLLQYLLVAILLIYFFKRITLRIKDKAVLCLVIASFIGLFSYQVFSVGYYFFREIRVGLFPWVLMGVAIGAYERYKLDTTATEIKK